MSEKSNLPYINNHTIPESVDFQFVHAAVVTFDFYNAPPTYDKSMKKLEQYCGWYQSIQPARAVKGAKHKQTKRKAASPRKA